MELTRNSRLILVFIAVTSVQMPADAAAMPSSVQTTIPKEKEIAECRIALDLDFDGRQIELRITDKKLVHKLVQDPMRKARKDDPSPPRYRGLGTLFIKYKDGSTVKCSLFHPWGRYKIGEQYMIADFTEVKTAFKKALENAQWHFK